MKTIKRKDIKKRGWKKLTNSQKKLIIRIYEKKGVQFGAFKLKLHEENPEAPLSPIYINLRIPPLTQEEIKLIAEEIWRLIKEQKILFDIVVGIPKAGTPLAKIISQLSGKPLIELSKKIEEGKRKIDMISGEYLPGQSVLIIDDLITEAHTKLEAIKVCEKNGLVVAGICVFIDRKQGGSEILRKRGYRVYAVFSLFMILNYYVKTNRITQEMASHVKNYINFMRSKKQKEIKTQPLNPLFFINATLYYRNLKNFSTLSTQVLRQFEIISEVSKILLEK